MAEKEKTPEKKLTAGQTVVSYLHDLVYILVIVCLLFLLVFRVVVVSGHSMNQTLLDGDYLLLISNLFYREPEYGDIVVISKQSFDNGSPIVKRVIATEGQTVDIDFTTGEVTVDGTVLEEDYIWSPTVTSGGMYFPLTVEEGCVFVMGDNRSNSRDSRYTEIGQVDCREILGKAFFLFLPGTDGTDIAGNPNEPRDFDRIGVID